VEISAARRNGALLLAVKDEGAEEPSEPRSAGAPGTRDTSGAGEGWGMGILATRRRLVTLFGEGATLNPGPPSRRRLQARLDEVGGVEVIAECSDGMEAVVAIEEGSPDVVFLDVRMPGLSGFQVVEAVGVQRMPPVVFGNGEYVLTLSSGLQLRSSRGYRKALHAALNLDQKGRAGG
jgi:CheY-like chemotaxis protein